MRVLPTALGAPSGSRHELWGVGGACLKTPNRPTGPGAPSASRTPGPGCAPGSGLLAGAVTSCGSRPEPPGTPARVCRPQRLERGCGSRGRRSERGPPRTRSSEGLRGAVQQRFLSQLAWAAWPRPARPAGSCSAAAAVRSALDPSRDPYAVCLIFTTSYAPRSSLSQ